MAENREITCINKQPRNDPWDRIKYVGGSGWKMSQPDAISAIERQQLNFYVYSKSAGKTVWVIIGKSRFGNKYLTTEADGESQNNLLALPECP